MTALSKVLRIDHVQLAMPRGREEHARGFYRDVLGMTEIPKPEPLAGRSGCWSASEDAQVHLGVEEDFRPAKKAHPALVVEGLDEILAKCEKAHPALVVEGLDEILAKCEKAGLASKPDAEIDGRRRVHVFDPFGNRLELIEAKSRGNKPLVFLL